MTTAMPNSSALEIASLKTNILSDSVLKKAKTSSQEFESVFLAQVLNTISEGLGQTDFTRGPGEEQWRSILNEYTARAVAARGGIGLSDGIRSEILKAQGA